jgi:hypothetical protein
MRLRSRLRSCGMGKASKKKVQRRHGMGESRADFVQRRHVARMAAAFRRVGDMQAAEAAEQAEAARAWCGGKPPSPAEIPRWAKGSAGERFFGTSSILEAAEAPSLANAILPAPDVMAASPAHWRVAAYALVRAVALDSLTVDDPAVVAVADLLYPAVSAELEYWSDETLATEFPELSGPLFLIGGVALFDATLAVVGVDEPLAATLAVFESRLDAVLEPLGLGTGLTGADVGAALISALTKDYAFDKPADVELLTRLQADSSTGNALEGLVLGKSIAPEDAIRVGLAVLADLADLCRTNAASVLAAQAPPDA